MKINGLKLDPFKHIHFTTVDLISAIKENKDKGACFLLDETRSSEQFGVGSRAYLGRLTDVINVSRAYGLNFIRISQEYRRSTVASHYCLDAFKIDQVNGLNKSLLMTTKGKYYGSVITKGISEEDELMIQYEKRKMEFIDKTMRQNETNRSEVQTKLAKTLLEEPMFHSAKNKQERYIVAQRVIGGETPKQLLELIITEALWIKRVQKEMQEGLGNEEN